MRVLCLLLLAIFIKAGSGLNCSDELVSHFYSKCVNNKRVAIYYYTTECEETDYVLPEPTYNLRCDIDCSAGRYLPFGKDGCSVCQPGTYSIGNGNVYSHWEPFPKYFTTYCTSDKNETCSSWSSENNGQYLSSGENPNDEIKSILKIQAKFLLSDGNKIRFTYKVDGESCKFAFCDGIEFFIDDILQESMQQSHVLQWTTVEFQLSPGFHSFQWTYRKDFSISQGQDKAFLRSIELYGTTSAPDECTNCVAGYFAQNDASSHCQECDYNEYSPEGSSRCFPCPPGSTALRGSDQCKTLSECQLSDYFPILEECRISRLTRKKTWGYWSIRELPLCNPTNIPAESEVPCSCPIGQQLNTNNGKCEYCPNGFSKGFGEITCTQCPDGSYAPKKQVFEEWSKLPSGFTSICYGDCPSEGWLPRGDKIVPAIESGQITSLLIYNFEIEQTGSIEIQYSNLCTSYSKCSFTLLIDPENDDPTSERLSYLYTNITKPLTQGKYTMTLQYVHSSDDLVDVSVTSIIIKGTTVGGASECLSCPPGTESTITSCAKCPRGKYSRGNGPCVSPPADAVVEEEGMSDYLTCGPNTVPNQEQTECTHDCTFIPDSLGFIKYDLKPLDDPINMHFGGAEQNGLSYYLNVCTRQNENGVCQDANGKALVTFGCQLAYGKSLTTYDIGKIIGFLPLEAGDLGYPPETDVLQKGLKVTFTEGQYGCNRTAEGRERSTTILMICDITAGVGQPIPKGKSAEVNGRPCSYEFVWSSYYACPVCSVEDYKTVLSECIDKKQYENHIKIKDCWDNEPPPSREIRCQSCEGNCSSRGVCDYERGKCTCEENFSGNACESCKLGKFGKNCEKTCPGDSGVSCNGHGSCFDGILGNGTCLCATGWTGEKCSTCDIGFQGDSCEPVPASITEVFPWWSFIIPVVVLVAAVAIGVIMWRQKKQIENRYRALEHSNPIPDIE